MPCVGAAVPAHWQTTRGLIDLRRPQVMGIVNVTPDSFSDGGRFHDVRAALRHCEALVAAGADILDIGGESTRPGAAMVDVGEELARVQPLLRDALRLGVPISIDTSRAAVMAACLDHGVDIINDVRALRAPGAVQVVAAHPACGICLMHMSGEPRDMQDAPQYNDVVDHVRSFLIERAGAVVAAGVASARIVLDPGIGFGKRVDHNLALLRHQAELLALGWPLMVGWSRKSTLGAITGLAVEHRVTASVAAALLAAQRGARILRVHDVAETVAALKVWRAAGAWGDARPEGTGDQDT